MNHSDPRNHFVVPRRDAADPGLRPHQSVPLRTLDSATLFRGEHEIGIEHQGALYRLKITRQGKLILNK